MSKETGGPAFPQHGYEDSRGRYWDSSEFGGTGLTLRDYFAGKVINAILSDPDAGLLDDDLTRYAGISYRAADAMLKARNQ